MLLKAFISTFVILYLCYECHGTTVHSSKLFESEGDSFIWNFEFLDSKLPSDFNGSVETNTTSPAQAGGIYWRDWKGKIPDDAIVAGYIIDRFGIKYALYFAQGFKPENSGDGIQPGRLFNTSTSLTVSYDSRVYQNSKNVKVLCGDQQAVAWVPVKTAENLNPDTDFVPAGFEKDFVLFFARSMLNGNRVMGKAVWSQKVMHFPDDGREKSDSVFDILCYKKKLTEKNITVPSGQIDD